MNKIEVSKKNKLVLLRIGDLAVGIIFLVFRKTNFMSIKFIVGLAVGAAIVHFLNTQEGRAFMGRIQKDTANARDNVNALADDLVEKGKSLMGIQEEEPPVGAILVVVEERV